MEQIKKCQFRHLLPGVFLGTASDRYAGWVGQIYSREKYEAKITKRSHELGRRSFVEEVLPVESIEEYFQHFSVLAIDYTFYGTLVNEEGKSTSTFQVLKRYRQHLRESDGVILKVPQVVTEPRVRVGGKFLPNEWYLNADMFITQFYHPAVELLGPVLTGFVFEQEYQRSEKRMQPQEMGRALDRFFGEIPRDKRYHIELRKDAYLSPPIFEILGKFGVGSLLSHWTWLPPLCRQFARAGGKFVNAGRASIIRLMTPLGVCYEDAYAKAYPFDKMMAGMMQEELIEDTVKLLHESKMQEVTMNVIINNRAGGNAPMIAQEICRRFLPPERVKDSLVEYGKYNPTGDAGTERKRA